MHWVQLRKFYQDLETWWPSIPHLLSPQEAIWPREWTIIRPYNDHLSTERTSHFIVTSTFTTVVRSIIVSTVGKMGVWHTVPVMLTRLASLENSIENWNKNYTWPWPTSPPTVYKIQTNGLGIPGADLTSLWKIHASIFSIVHKSKKKNVPKSPWADEKVRKVYKDYVYYSAFKKREILPFVTTLLNSEVLH